jgi:hypothetical protein
MNQAAFKPLLVIAFAAAPFAATAQADLDRIARCMRDNLPKNLSVGSVSLTVMNGAGSGQTMFGSLGTQSGAAGRRMVWSIRAPSDLAGSAVLIRDDSDGTATWLYLPSLGQPRRVQQADREGRMFGTDISYGDAERIVSAFAGSTLTVLGEDRYAGRPVWKIAATTPPELAGAYDRIDLSIDQSTCVTLAADLLKNDQALKRWTVDAGSLTQSGRYWYAAAGTMTDLQRNTATQVRFSRVGTDRPLPESSFDPRGFYRGGGR